MLGFKIGDHWLDLSEKMSINLTMLNPIFDKEGLQRVFSYSLRFPNTPHNNAQFQHSYRIDTKGQKYYSMSLYIDHVKIEEGIFTLQGTRNNYSGVLSNTPILIAKKYKEARLRKLDMEEIIPIANPVTNTFVTVNNSTSKICMIVINNQRFYCVVNDLPSIIDQINLVHPGVAALVSHDVNGQTETLTMTITWQDANTPLWINTELSTNPRYTTFLAQAPVVFAAPIVNLAWAIKLEVIKQNPTTHCFPVIRNTDLYDGQNPTYSGYINYINTVVGNYPIGASQPSEQWAQTLVPYVFVKEVLRVIADLDGFVCTGDWYNEVEMDECIVHSNLTLDYNVSEVLNTGGGNTGGGVYNTMKPKYNLAHHLPDISVFDFLQKLRSNFFLWFNIENGQLQINTAKQQLLSETEDWTDKVSPIPSKSISKGAGLDFDYEYDRTEDEHNDNVQLQPVSIEGDSLIPPQSWPAGFFSLFMLYDINHESIGQMIEMDWLTPIITEKGTVPFFNLKNEPEARLLFYKGLQEDSSGGLYPFATSQDTNGNGDVIGSQTLNIAGEKGLYEKRGKEFLRLLTDGDGISMSARLTVADILNLKKWQNVRKYIYHPQGSFVGIIKSVKIKATQLGIVSAVVDFVKV